MTTTTSVQALYTNILRRDGSATEVANWVTLIDGGTLTLAQAQTAINNSSETANYVDPVIRLYQSSFGRQPDSAGLTNWSNAMRAGTTIEEIAAGFSTSTEFTNKYGTNGSVDTAYLTALYLNVLSRTPSGAEVDAWVATGKTRAQVLQGFSDSPEFVSNSQSDVNKILDNAAAGIALDPTKALSATTGGSSDTTSGSGGVTGTTYTLTTSVDALTGTDNNDTFTGVFNTNIAAGSTMNSGDSLDGGAGTDTLNITISDANAGAAAITLSNMENVIATSYDGTAAPTAFNASNWSGVSKIGLKNTTTTHATQNAFTVTALQANATLSLDNITLNADNDLLLDVDFASGKVGSATATLAIQTSSTGTSTKDGLIRVTDAGTDKFTAMSIAATGTNALTIDFDGTSTTSLDSLTVTGTGSIKLTDNDAELDGIKTVTASDNSGGLTVDLQNNTTENMSITGGSGNDTLTAALNQNLTLDAGAGDDTVTLQGTVTTATLTSDDSIDGGAGTDVLVMEDSEWDALDGDSSGDRATIKNFETARVSDALATTIDISKFSGMTNVQVTQTQTSDAAKVSGLASGSTVEVRGNGDWTEEVELTVTGATNANTPSDTLTLKMNADLTANLITQTSFAVEGVNQITVTTADRDNDDGATDKTEGYSLDFEATKASNVDTLTITGDRAFWHYVDSDTDALATVNASGNSGQTTVSFASFNGTQGATITGGSAENTLYGTSLADTITGGADGDILQGAGGKDTISGGADIDYVDGGAAADTMTGGDGADYFYVNANASSAVDSITDFVAGTDKIVYSGTAFGGSIVEVTTNLEDKATLADAATTAGSTIGASNAGTFTYASNKYLLIDANTTTGFTDGTDILVKMTGMTGTFATTDFATTGITFTSNELNETFVGTVGDDTFSFASIDAGATITANGSDTIASFTVADDLLDFDAIMTGGVDQNGGAGTAITLGAAGTNSDWLATGQVGLFDDAGTALTTTTVAAEFGGTASADFTGATTQEAIFISGQSGTAGNVLIWYVNDNLDGTNTDVTANDVRLIGTIQNLDINTLTTANIDAA